VEDPKFSSKSSEANEALAWLYIAAARIPQLTPQQGRVLACLAVGMEGRSISRSLACKERTVKLHVSGLIQRLGVRSRIQAALVGYYAIYVGEFPCPSGLCTKRHLYSAAEVLDAGDAGGQEDSKQAK
jgi:DNA-binding CsgD family transcriptional regulator